MATVTICSDFAAQENKLCHCSPIYLPREVMGLDAMIFVFCMLSFKPAFSLSSFTFNISPTNEYSGLISFRMDWLDLLAVKGLKSLLQHHSLKALILWHSAFVIVQVSHPNMTTGKTIALTRWTFVGKVISLLFNMLSRFVITFLLRRVRLLISCLKSSSAVILEPPKMKSDTVSSFSIYLP